MVLSGSLFYTHGSWSTPFQEHAISWSLFFGLNSCIPFVVFSPIRGKKAPYGHINVDMVVLALQSRALIHGSLRGFVYVVVVVVVVVVVAVGPGNRHVQSQYLLSANTC
ncbi:hypothetical protein BS50DRAFT_648004 [Corynespora cassiicola Philippines]|uniref:Uncharacterized protein n=1 Tax=Corynespora cassiicola Philippines TaxID=1448308 RepID=A0A2T2NF90_CORCC|nr:hypothetical protein BS50DRAFT_648004 [Corynespora cassiicola Philippines]